MNMNDTSSSVEMEGRKTDKKGSVTNDVFFNIKPLQIKNRYVLFVDIMGMKTTMARSFKRSAIFMGKFHVALRKAAGKLAVDVFPVMDGAYVVSEKWSVLNDFISDFYMCLGRLMVATSEIDECFLIRGGVAFGPVIIGKDISAEVSAELSNDDSYRQRLICGFPLILSYECEGKAPPFGVYIDTSVRIAESGGVSGIWLHGWSKDSVLTKALPKKIGEYFSAAKLKNEELLYDREKLVRHEMLAQQYWN